MWVRRAAIRPIEPYARVSGPALDRVERSFGEDDEGSESLLARSFDRFERTQPALSSRIAQALGRPIGETAMALGYFLSLAVWMSFEQSFGPRLAEVAEQEVDATFQSIALDEQIRQDAPDEAVETDDVVAMEQPEVVEFIREHIDVALEGQTAEEARLSEVDAIYRLLLVEVVALSHAVAPPEHYPPSRGAWSA